MPRKHVKKAVQNLFPTQKIDLCYLIYHECIFQVLLETHLQVWTAQKIFYPKENKGFKFGASVTSVFCTRILHLSIEVYWIKNVLKKTDLH